MIEKTWEDFFSRLDELVFEPFDLIVAIARGGILPASFIQRKLNLPLKILNIRFRDDNHTPLFEHAQLLEEEHFSTKGKKILLVDDVSRTGETLRIAKNYLEGNEIKTCLVNGPGDYFFFQSPTCLRMPWMR